ncbi:MAG TPA: hypothetical protein VIL30_16825 [Ramlibacter sp.]|jgi:hypothetical protein
MGDLYASSGSRIIKFQGRTIQLPSDATDDQVRQVLQAPPLPEGFQFETEQLPPLPPGFVLEEPTGSENTYSDALAAGSAASQFGPGRDTSAPALPPPEEPDLLDHIMGGLDYAGNTGAIVADRIGQGASNIAGLPVDLINAAPMLANLLPGVDGVGPISPDPIGGSEWVNSARKGFGVIPDAPEPQDWTQVVAGRVGEELGATLLPGAGILGAAGRKGVQAIRSSANPLTRTFLEQAAVNPARFVSAEVAGATAAGTGAGLANLVADRETASGQVADLAGALSGATVAGIGGTLSKGLGNVFNAVRQNPNYVDQVVKDAVVDRIGKAAGLSGSETANGVFDTDELVATIMGTTSEAQRVAGVTPVQRPSDIIPGFQESLADVTANPGLASLEYSRQSGPNAGMFTKQRSANNELVDTIMGTMEPTQTPGAFRSELEAQRDLRLSKAAQDTQSAQSEFDRYIQNLVPTMGAEDRGATIRQGLANAERSARDVERMAWEGIDGEVETGPLADMLDETVGGLTQARQQSISDVNQTVAIPRQLAGTADEPAGPVRLRELIDMRSSLLTQQRNAVSDGDRNRADALGRLIADVNTYLDSEAVASEVRAQTADARGLSRNVNERFNRPNDPIAATLATSEGRPDLPDSAVGPRFVQPDARQASNIDRLLAETDLSSQGGSVRAAVKDEILAGIDRKSATPSPARLERYLGQFTRAFDRFPDLRDEVTQAVSSGRAFDQASATETALISDVGSADGTVKGRGPVGRYLQYSDAQSERAISEVLSAKDPGRVADDLLSFIDNNPSATEGARAAFWQKLKTESQSVDNSQRTMGGGRAWRGDWLKSFLDKPSTAAVAERLYRDSPDDLEQIRKFANVLDNVDLRQRGKAVGTSGTAQSVNPVLTPETLQSRFYAYTRGQVSGTYLATSIAAVLARRAVRNAQTDAIERLTDQVLLNPKLAAELLKDNNPANRAAFNRKAKLWLGNEASTFLNLLADGDDDQDQADVPASDEDDLVNMVMR